MKNNAYVMFLDNMYEDDWQALSKIDKEDRVVFLINKDGYIPYQTIPYFMKMKSVPEMQPFADANDTALSFFLGCQCGSISGSCYVIGPEDKLGDIGDFVDTVIGDRQIIIRLCESLEDALRDKRSRNEKKEKKSDEENETEYCETDASELPDDDFEMELEPAPEKFVAALSKLSPRNFDLLEYKDQIYECVKKEFESVVDTFQFEVNVHIGEPDAAKVYELLKDHIEDLKMVCE